MKFLKKILKLDLIRFLTHDRSDDVNLINIVMDDCPVFKCSLCKNEAKHFYVRRMIPDHPHEALCNVCESTYRAMNNMNCYKITRYEYHILKSQMKPKLF